MLFFNKLLGFRDFSKLEEIKDYISANFSIEQDENIAKAQELIIFETSRQKTWLLVTENKIFCILDDIDKDSFDVRWHLTKDKLVEDNKVILDIRINSDYKANTGLVDFGQNHKNWLYSKKLFPTSDNLKQKIIGLINHKMLTNWDLL